MLCDALTYAQRRWNPSMIVDVATLTGACVVALGDDVAGLFCQDATLAQRIKDFGDIVGEPYWPLPLWDRYFELLKSETADFANAGAREMCIRDRNTPIPTKNSLRRSFPPSPPCAIPDSSPTPSCPCSKSNTPKNRKRWSWPIQDSALKRFTSS